MLRFNKRIYKKKAIQNAVLAYIPFARFKIADSANHTLVGIEVNEQKDREVLTDEFSNYVLGMTKKCL